MKTYTILLIAILSFCNSFIQAQQVYADIGVNDTKFNYTNSEGEGLDNLHSEMTFNYNVGYRATITDFLYLSGALSYNKYSMYGSDQVYDNYYAWNPQYIGVSLGVDGEFLKVKKFSFFIRVVFEPQFLIGGTQQINEQVFSLKGVEQFDNPFFFLKGGLGINYCADANIAVSLKYLYGYSFPMGKSADNEKLNIASNSISIGLTLSLKNCRYCNPKHF